MEESNRFARQKLATKPDKLERWVNITLPELKAYLGIAIIMGINYNPRTAMYWSADEFYESRELSHEIVLMKSNGFFISATLQSKSSVGKNATTASTRLGVC